MKTLNLILHLIHNKHEFDAFIKESIAFSIYYIPWGIILNFQFELFWFNSNKSAVLIFS